MVPKKRIPKANGIKEIGTKGHMLPKHNWYQKANVTKGLMVPRANATKGEWYQRATGTNS